MILSESPLDSREPRVIQRVRGAETDHHAVLQQRGDKLTTLRRQTVHHVRCHAQSVKHYTKNKKQNKTRALTGTNSEKNKQTKTRIPLGLISLSFIPLPMEPRAT